MSNKERSRLIESLTSNTIRKQSKGSLVTKEAIYSYYECLTDNELIELHKRIINE